METFYADRDYLAGQLKQNQRSLGFFDRNVRYMIARSGGVADTAFAYFGADGCLLRVYADNDTELRLARRGIVPGTVWTVETAGKNAVTAGLRLGTPRITHEGAESAGKDRRTAPDLFGITVGFAPVPFKPMPVNGRYILPERLGGIAVFAPGSADPSGTLFLATALAYDLVMNMHFNQTSISFYERSKSGILIIDTRIREGQGIVTYANDLLFKALGVEIRSLDFRPLSEFLPPEKNRRFYELVEQPRSVSDLYLPLEAEGGKRTSCTVTCVAYDQPGINAGGITVYVTTPQIESQNISKAIGNTAVLSFESVIGECALMRSAKRRAALIAGTDSNVLILGESGVGKDVFAQAIHNASSRKNKPFIAVNCAALPRDLIASELFGYDSGAFTGAKKNGNMGKFELANGGTIFLDEIGDLPLDLQATLLRVVEQKQFMRLGGTRLIDIDVKIISATNANLSQLVEQKRFRSDLYFRLGTMRLALPPLRERGNDILLLAEHFVAAACRRILRAKVPEFSPEAVSCLLALPWPGNVRELQNVMECIAQLYPQDTILPEYILENVQMQGVGGYFGAPQNPGSGPAGAYVPAASAPSGTASSASSGTAAAYPFGTPSAGSGPAAVYPFGPPPHIPRKRHVLTEEEIRDAIRRCGGNRSAAAEYLGVGRKTLYRYIERLGIEFTEP